MNAHAPATLRTARQLREAGLIGADPALDKVVDRYSVAIPAVLAADITASGADGPLARQYLPSAEELRIAPHEIGDPTGDETHSPVKGVVHRYPDRALLLPTQICAVYCRFCFRRERVGPAAGALSDADLAAALDYIASTPAIWEVILSGGDPFVLSRRRLAHILGALDRMAHVAVIRVHTRVPVAAPDMVDESLVAALKETGKPVYVVVHCNHAGEVSARAMAAFCRLRESSAILLSQSVLLRGVNDSERALENLFRTLVAAGVKPYYLHQLDPAPGTARFHVPLERGRALVKSLRGRLSGLAQPVFVLDVPGGSGKVPVGPNYVRGVDGGFELVEGLDGVIHSLPPD